MVGLVAVLVVASAGWWALGRWRSSKGPDAVARAGAVARRLGQVLVAIPLLAVCVAMLRGCEGDGDGRDGRPRPPACETVGDGDCLLYPGDR